MRRNVDQEKHIRMEPDGKKECSTVMLYCIYLALVSMIYLLM